MPTETPATMSPAQITYVAARALYDSAIAEMSRVAPAPGPDASEDIVDAWLDASEQAHNDLGLDRLFNALRMAEDAMLAWSFEVARREAGTSRAKLKLIAQVEAGMCKPQHLITRNKAIDLALRLAA